MELQDVINNLNRVVKSHFNNQTPSFKPVSVTSVLLVGQNNSLAVDHHKSTVEQVKVVNLFDEFWLSVYITFKPQKVLELLSFSLSVFKGTEADDYKQQIFRAEWNYYENDSSHPQPHWHFYSNSEVEYLKKQFSEIVENDKGSFLSELANESQSKMRNVTKMHFAMNSQWQIRKGHSCSLESATTFINWFDGLLGHLKEELAYSLQ